MSTAHGEPLQDPPQNETSWVTFILFADVRIGEIETALSRGETKLSVAQLIAQLR